MSYGLVVTEVDKAYLMHDWIDLFTIDSAAASSPPSSLLLQEENKLSSQKLPDNHADSANLCQYFFGLFVSNCVVIQCLTLLQQWAFGVTSALANAKTSQFYKAMFLNCVITRPVLSSPRAP
ncbi:hypothetical protein T05_11629 [Trichinella murrelli]|uniref:Uncharacterized protein n=1 Tax=Trichinella murrelli TaxID=144512 RepID=A0A0V0T9D9_9BILA|nr:hypothetical protein T05_11629 [Trichinella murrelli]